MSNPNTSPIIRILDAQLSAIRNFKSSPNTELALAAADEDVRLSTRIRAEMRRLSETQETIKPEENVLAPVGA